MEKINRNALCPCGSGRRYKNCCLYNKADQIQEAKANGLALLGKFKNEHKDKEMTWDHTEDVGTVKMSEVIIDFADELLSQFNTKETKKMAIGTAIFAWNLALTEESERESKIEELINAAGGKKGSQEWDDLLQVLEAFIYKKELKYPSINQLILSFEFIETKNGDHLNIISSEVLND